MLKTTQETMPLIKLHKNAISFQAKVFIILLIILMSNSNQLSAQIAAWDFTGIGSTTIASTPATTFNPNLVSTSNANHITRGAGAAWSAGGNSWRTTGFQNNGISTANTDYFQITLSATPGNLLSLSTIDARFAGTSTFAASPGVSHQFAYSLDGTNFSLIGSPQVTVGTPATLTTINLSSISALQNVAASVTVTLRYYASGQTATGGWGFNSPTAGQNGLAIGGSITPAAIPPTQLVITSLSTQVAGAPFSVTVESRDGSNVLQNVSSATNFTLSTNGNAGSIGGTTTGTIANGTSSVTVSGVTLPSAGTLVTLTATQTSGSDVLSAGTSNTFTVNPAASPLITITGALTSFSTVVGSPSASQSYQVSGANLSSDIIITPPADFEIRTGVAAFSNNPLTLAQSGGSVLNTTIDVRYNPAAAGSTGALNITHVTTSDSKNQAVTGSSIAAEPNVAGSVSFGAVTPNSIVINFSGGNGANRIVVVSASAAVTYIPADGASVPGTVSSVFTTATDQGSGNKVVYDGNGNTVTVTGLNFSTNYHVAVYEYNGTAATANYFATPAINNTVTTSPNLSYATVGSTYTQNFDNLPNSGTFTFTGAGPFYTVSPPINSPATNGWQFYKYTGSGSNALFSFNDGIGTSGSAYSYGTNLATERSFGSLLSGTTGSRLGIVITNNTGSALTQINVSFTGEQWRYGGSSADSLLFGYLVGGTDIATGTFTLFTPLNFIGPISTGTAGSLDGNISANRTAITASLALNSPWLDGTNLVLRWEDINCSGSDNGLAIDDFSFSACSSPALAINSVTNTCTSLANGAINIDVTGGIPPLSFLWSNSATTEDISSVAAGTYTITVTALGGCTSTISAIVAPIALPTVNFSGLPSTICVNAASLTLTGNQAPAGSFTGNGITDNGNGTATFNPATAGVGGPYTITYSYTDISTGCSNSQIQTVTVNDAPNIGPISPVSNSCPVASFDLASIVLLNTGAAGTSSYFATLSDANNNINSISATVNSPGTYFIRVTTASGCFDVESVTVTIIGCGCANPPTANAGSNFSICADGTAQLNGSIGGGATSLTWSGGAGTFAPNANTANAIYTPTAGEITGGSVTLIITTDDPDGAGSCVAATSNVTITINPLPAISVNPSTVSICAGSATGNIIANGGTTYSWSPAADLNVTTGSTVIASPAANTTYTVTGINANGCANTATVTVTTNPLPVLIITPPSPSICAGSSTTINLTGASTYTWANASGLSATTGSTVTANPTATTIYTVTGTDVLGCTSTSTVQVVVNPLPVVSISGSPTICNSSSALLDAGAGFSGYLWSTSATSQTITTSISGTYTVTVTDLNGCSNLGSKNLAISNPPTISSITSQATCYTNSGAINLEAAGGTPCAVTSPGLIISKVLPNPDGSDSPYELVELVATKNIDFAVTPYSVIFSNNGAANASGWIAGAGLTYGFEITSGTAVPGSVYYVGGSLMAPLNNRLRTINTATTGGDGGIGNASASGVLGNGGTNADGVAVFNGNIISLSATSVPVDAFFYGTGIGGAAVAGGTQGYQLPVNDLYNGGKLQSASFFGPEPLSGQFIKATGVYNGFSNTYTTPRTWTTSTNLDEGVSGITTIIAAPYSYNWSNGSTNQNLTAIGAGTYTVTVADCNGCTVTASATVSVSSSLKPYLQEGDSVLCSNDQGFNMHVLDSGNYTAGYPFGTLFNFYGAGAILYQSGTSNVFFNQNNSDAFYVEVILPNYLGSCNALTDTSVIDFGAAQAPQYVLSTDSVSCKASATGNAIVNIIFGGTTNFRYQWYPSGSNTAIRDVTKSGTTDSLKNVTAGMYILVITDHQGATVPPYCSVTDSIYVGEPLAPLSVSENIGSHVDVVCYGELTGSIGVNSAGGTPAYAYLWSNGSLTNTISGIGAGTYTVTVTDSRGCTATLSIIVTQAAQLAATISGPTSFCSGNSTTLNAGNGFSNYNWSTGAITQTISVNTAGTFTVTVTDANGCTASASVTTTVNANPILVTTMKSDASLNGGLGTAGVTAIPAGCTFLWSPGGQTTNYIQNKIPGTYQVTVTSPDGCTKSVSIIVN